MKTINRLLQKYCNFKVLLQFVLKYALILVFISLSNLIYATNYSLNGENGYVLSSKTIQITNLHNLQMIPFLTIHTLEEPYKNYFVPPVKADGYLSSPFSLVPVGTESIGVQMGLENNSEISFRFAISTPELMRLRYNYPGIYTNIGYKKEFLSIKDFSMVYKIDGFCYYNGTPGVGTGLKNSIGLSLGKRDNTALNIFGGFSTILEFDANFDCLLFTSGYFYLINSPYFELNITRLINKNYLFTIGTYMQYDFVYDIIQDVTPDYMYHAYFTSIRKVVSMMNIGVYVSFNFRITKSNKT